MDSIKRSTGTAPLRSIEDAKGAPLGEKVKIGELLLSQSGQVALARDGQKQRPLVPGQEGAFTELVVTGLSPSGTRFENRFPIDDKGMLQWTHGQPLGHVPYEVTLVGKDGAKYSGIVDVTPSKVKSTHSGYELLKNLELVKERPPPPALVDVPELLLSQSGQIALARDGQKQRPLVPGHEGAFTELVVTGLSPSGTRFENRFPIDDKGMLQWTRGQPLGHVPYEVTLVGADGARYRGVVDITPSKIKSTHSGYEALKNLKLERVAVEAPSDRESVANFAAQKPLAAKTSPLQAFWNKS